MTFSPSRADLERMFPRPKSTSKRQTWDAYMAVLTSDDGARLLEDFEIVTPARWHGVCGTWSPETGDLSIFWESGAYTASGIMRVFGVGRHSAAVTEAEARHLAGNGPALFERVYGLGNPRKAKELGNTEPGDGWRFRGMGPNQLTGRWAHEKCAAEIGCSLDDLATPMNALRASLLEWRDKGCNGWADKQDWTSIRKLINGGSLKVPASRLNGLQESLVAVRRAQKVWPELKPQINRDLVPDEVPVDVKPLPEPEVTAKDLVGVSRKITLLARVKQALAIIGIGTGGTVTLADFTEQKDTLHAFTEFLGDHALVLVGAGLVAGFLVSHLLEKWIVQDHNDGRYVPKGAD